MDLDLSHLLVANVYQLQLLEYRKIRAFGTLIASIDFGYNRRGLWNDVSRRGAGGASQVQA